MKRKYFLIIAAAVMLIGSLSGCGNEADETATQNDLFQRAMCQTRALAFFKCESNRNKRYLCKKVEEGYELTVYSSLGTIIVSEVYPKEPGISWITENVIEIAISTGSPARYVYYVDMNEDKVSDVYFNPFLVEDEYVAYMEDGEMILSDIFYTDQQEDLLYMTVVRDFTKTANPMSAIIGIELIDSGNIALTYLIGEDYTEVTEMIPIDKDTEPEHGEYLLSMENRGEEKQIHITIEDAETLERAEQTLIACPTESLVIYVAAEEPDMQVAAERIKQCWEVNHERHHYSVSIADVTEQTEKSNALLAFLDLFGEEGAALMEQAAKEEDSYISFIRLERVDGLDICTFAVRTSEEEQYHLMLAGEWEETEVSFTHLLIPVADTNKYETWFGFYCDYNISQADVNFDGKEDLLIHEGFAGGAGGSYEEFRAVVWEENKKEFVWYPSFPERLDFLEFNEQRMINSYRLGAGYEVVCEYGVVDGEYVMTRELIWEFESIDKSTLSYYEMDVLVEQHDVTGMDWDEVISLYPNLDYWSRG